MMKLGDIAEFLGAELRATKTSGKVADLEIVKLAAIDRADKGTLSFVGNEAYEKHLGSTKATAVLVAKFHEDVAVPQLVHPNPYLAFAQIAQKFVPVVNHPAGVSDRAFVAKEAKLGQGAVVYPNCYVAKGASLGTGVILYPGVFVGENTKIGDESVLYPHVVVREGCEIGKRCIVHPGTVIGADGFGFALDKDEIVKIPQTGGVKIGDDVELGALCTIDRATLGTTTVGSHSKFDNHVHIAHNIEIGEKCLFAAFVGIAGSTKVGDHVQMGGHSAIAGHKRIASRVSIGARAGVTKDIAAEGVYMGFPAQPAVEWRKQTVYQKRLAQYEAKIRKLEGELQELKKQFEDIASD